jgi:hypothetical protein
MGQYVYGGHFLHIMSFACQYVYGGHFLHIMSFACQYAPAEQGLWHACTAVAAQPKVLRPFAQGM